MTKKNPFIFKGTDFDFVRNKPNLKPMNVNQHSFRPAGQAGVFTYKNGQKANYGTIRFNNDSIVHYTGKGLREMYNNNSSLTEEQIQLAKTLKAKSEEELIASEHIDITRFEDVLDVDKH
jgi:hypothetical protein